MQNKEIKNIQTLLEVPVSHHLTGDVIAPDTLSLAFDRRHAAKTLCLELGEAAGAVLE